MRIPAHTRPRFCTAHHSAWVVAAVLPAVLCAWPTDLNAQFFSYQPPIELPPKITQESPSTTVETEQTATFAISVAADFGNYVYPKITFQWLKDGARITGATNAKLTLTNVQVSHAGKYLVVASNCKGWVSSSPIELTVLDTKLPLITESPASQTVPEGQDASFTVAAAGSPSFTYRWRRNGVFLSGATQSRLTVAKIRPSDAGSYDVLVGNLKGNVFSRAAVLVVLPPEPSAVRGSSIPGIEPTRITTQPRGADLHPGETHVLSFSAAGENLTFQWKKNGVVLPGVISPTYTVAQASAADMGFYSVVVSGDNGAVESEPATLTVAATSPSRIANVSTRGLVPAYGALAVGFALGGPGAKQLLVRAIGPALTRFGLAGVLADPTLAVFAAGAPTPRLANNDWGTTASQPVLVDSAAAVGAFPLTDGAKDAAVLARFAATDAQSGSVRITSADPAADGIALAEIYDVGAFSDPGRLTAISALGLAGAGDRALTMGFTLAGPAPKRLLLRAIGPGLERFGATPTLADPQITLRAAGLNRAIAANDDWGTDPTTLAAITAAGAFPLEPGSKDAAVVVSLPPGSYTIEAYGKGNDTGSILIEVYDLDL